MSNDDGYRLNTSFWLADLGRPCRFVAPMELARMNSRSKFGKFR